LADGTLHLWDAENGNAVRVLRADANRTLQQHSWKDHSVAWSPRAQWLVSSGPNSTVYIWDAEAQDPVTILEGHTGPITKLSFSHDGELLITLAEDQSLRYWRTSTWEPTARVEGLGNPEATLTLALHPAKPLMALHHRSDETIDIFSLDYSVLLQPTLDA